MIRPLPAVRLVLGFSLVGCGAAHNPATASPPLGPGALPADWGAPPTNGSPGANVPKLSGNNLIANGTFNDGKMLPWANSFSVPAAGRSFVAKDGELCAEITNKGANNWDVQLRHREMVIQKGHTYSISIKAHATRPTRMRAKVGMAGPPYAEYWTDTMDLLTRPQTFVGTFTMAQNDDPTAEFALHLGGEMAGDGPVPFNVCIDDVSLDDPQFVRKEVPRAQPIPAVLVNQIGYLPYLPKLATVKNAAKTPQIYQLLSSGGKVVASGTTLPVGLDATSGDSVHLADFSSFGGTGKGFTLKVGQEVSHPFDIEPNIYRRLKYDALAYFYHNRSGIEIALPFAGDKQWTRPAGHVGAPPNQGDKSVPCLPNSGCTYSLDVSGGWYDAGDHGKYVVNAGISVWTLLNQYERARRLGTAGDFADGKLAIPEKKNRVPDILDEARWELEFELRMQVPAGQPLAGMVHHKVHDLEWTALGTAPHQDPIKRYLWPPSTAATLNLAANAAQAARIWERIDKNFAARCLDAAEHAWVAAQAHPAILAGTAAVGGGPYDDKNVTDEMYWAAAELYTTTRKEPYRAFLTSSPHFKSVPIAPGDEGLPSPMTWGQTQALGTITLAMVKNGLPKPEIAEARKNIQAAADAYVDLIKGQGYRVPFKPGKKGFPWGSNSFVLNNMIVMALAFDFTREPRYLEGVNEGMNYLLGRNPLDQSFVTGHGERPLEHPHHRFWAHQINAAFPPPPPGAISGGPNSGLQDPYVQAAGLAGCAPAKCFVDHIEAWSTNEIAINWNAPLAWTAAFLDEKGGAPPQARTASRERVGK
ncbi:MAG TPA: glycoside hydrolase family 9 protein [Polyangia bacterium]|nr:glycoside hydrolase family 9 protein [Polyangia bacterium]